MITAEYNCIGAEKNGVQFVRIVEMIKPTLALLQRLKREGKLEGQPLFGEQMIGELTDDLIYCEAAPQALKDLKSITSYRFGIAARLYALRASTLAGRADVAALVATAKTVCDLVAKNDKFEPMEMATAAAACVAAIDTLISHGEKSDELVSLRQRCRDRGFALLSQGVEYGYSDAGRLEDDPVFKTLRSHPGYPALVERARRSKPGT
jgi:hypothetical protein